MDLKELNAFLGEAAISTYAGGGPNVDPETPGLKELEFRRGDWYYRDSYTGFFQSWGRETIWFQGEPCWTQLYGGGMAEKYHRDATFAHQTFDFLKKALSAGEKRMDFQPRGPAEVIDGDWTYLCRWDGDMTKFLGHETIHYHGQEVFTHDFFGGLILAR